MVNDEWHTVKIKNFSFLTLSFVAVILLLVGFETGLYGTSVVFIVTIGLNSLFLWRRLGFVFGGAIGFLIQSVIVLFAGLLGVALPLAYAQTMGLSLILGSFFVGFFALRFEVISPFPRIAWGPAQWSALTGPIFFVATFFASKLFTGGNLYAWVMNNDAVNNILMVRDLVNDGGIILGEGGNPVPFTTSMLSLFLAGPSTNYESHGNLQHDVLGMEYFWLATVVILGLCAGLLAAEMIRRKGKSLYWGITGAVVASLATNMWFIVGYPIEYGFLNAALGLALLLISVLVYQFYPERPAAALGAMFLASILILATWTPTVLFLLAFVISIVVSKRQELFVRKSGVLATWILPLFLAVLFFFLVTVPSFIRTSSLLSAQGGVEHFPLTMLWLMPLAIIFLAFLVYGLKSPQGWAYAAIGLSQLVAVGGLIFLNRSLEDPWTYYPLKMLWFGSAFIALLAIPLGFISIARLKKPLMKSIVAAGLILVVFLGLNWSLPKPSTFAFKGTTSILFSPQSELFNDEVAQQMFSDDQEGLVVYWVSQRGDQASALNFWNISSWANSLKPDVYDIRYLAYYLPPTDPALLCTLSDLANTRLTVVTDITDLAMEVSAICPGAEFVYRKG